MRESIYQVITPAGAFSVAYGDDDNPYTHYSGNQQAIQFFKDWMQINQISGQDGWLLNPDSLDPSDLFGFCQPPDSGITVIPPFDDMLAYETEAKETDATTQTKDDMTITLDAVSGVEKLSLIKELKGIRGKVVAAKSGVEKLGLIKRIKEIRAIILGNAPAEDNQIGAEQTKPKATIADVNAVMTLLKQFIGKSQLSAMGAGVRGEEGQFFKDKFVEVAKVIEGMPHTYQTDGQGDKAIAYLHYFKGGMDWYITEKDAGDVEDEKEGISGQVQAFGYADLGQGGGELGYIGIKELIEAGVELDLYWKPKTIGEIIGKAGHDDSNDMNKTATANEQDPIKSAFITELEALKSETDIYAFDQKLDEIAGRIEAAGLMEALDKELNETADVLTELLAAAEKNAPQ